MLTVSSDTWTQPSTETRGPLLWPLRLPGTSPMPSPLSNSQKSCQCRSTRNLLSHQAIKNELLTLPSHPRILNNVFPADKDVLPRNHKTTTRMRKLTSLSYYPASFQIPVTFPPVVSAISFKAKDPVQDLALHLSCLLLFPFKEKRFLSLFSLWSWCFWRL